jgi:hypothetical protein
MGPVRMQFGYEMKDSDGKHIASGVSKHCFLGESGVPMRLNRSKPEFYEEMKALCEEANRD